VPHAVIHQQLNGNKKMALPQRAPRTNVTIHSAYRMMLLLSV